MDRREHGHTHQHGHDHDHNHDHGDHHHHDHDHRHDHGGPGHNRAPKRPVAQWQTPHSPGEQAPAAAEPDLDKVEAAFIDGFIDAPDPVSFLRLGRIPFEMIAADGATLLVNISNDGWFGRSAAARQHLLMARVRAVENRRWLLRVTNNGFTASVDPYGRIYEPLPTDVRASADLPYDFRTDRTIYARFGDWFAWLCVAVSAILLASTFWKGNVSRDSIPIPVDFLASPIRVVPAPVSSRSPV